MRTQTRTWRQRLLSGVCWLMAIEGLVFAPFKLTNIGFASMNWPSYPEKFEAWGFPPEFSYVVGAGEILAAVMFLLPRRRFVGAVIMVITLTGGMVTHVINQDSVASSISAPIHFVLAVGVALATWPADWREPLALRRRPAALDLEAKPGSLPGVAPPS